MQDVVQRLKKRWFLISLVIVFTIGMVGHKTLARPEMKNLRSGIVFVVLYLMAAPLSSKGTEFWDPKTRRGPTFDCHELRSTATGRPVSVDVDYE